MIHLLSFCEHEGSKVQTAATAWIVSLYSQVYFELCEENTVNQYITRRWMNLPPSLVIHLFLPLSFQFNSVLCDQSDLS